MLESLPSQHLPDICAALVKASYTEKIQVLDAVDLTDRFRKALPLLMRQIEVSQLSLNFLNGLNNSAGRLYVLRVGGQMFASLPRHTRDDINMVPVAPLPGTQHVKG